LASLALVLLEPHLQLLDQLELEHHLRQQPQEASLVVVHHHLEASVLLDQQPHPQHQEDPVVELRELVEDQRQQLDLEPTDP
jgi:hypothetical protein